jgi:limonene 1,2-monooxygenase
MVDARLNLRPYTKPCFPLTVAAAVSPSGARLAGQHGAGLLSMAASSAAGFEALLSTWQIVEEQAEIHGQTVQRDDWRVNGFFHVADTEEEARRNVRFGIRQFVDYFNAGSTLFSIKSDGEDLDEVIDEINNSGFGCIGSPDRMNDMVERYWKQTGGFGTLLSIEHGWADRENTLKSYDLIANYVMPKFNQDRQRPKEQFEWARDKGGWSEQSAAARTQAKQKYEHEMGRP